MTRTKKFEELRKQLKSDLRNPGCIELDEEIKNMGKVNKAVFVGIGCVALSAAAYAIWRANR